MTQPNLDRLYDLLPMIYRQRDAEQGYPLRALLQVIAEQVNVVEADIAQLYENWFIETCEDWVVPYLADLVGYQAVFEAGDPIFGAGLTERERRRNQILVQRREVANTIGYRRRKGALALLEILANESAGWPARAVEFFPLLGQAQHTQHLRPGRGRTADLRQGSRLDRLNGPFEELGHSVDVRRIVSPADPGRYNLPEVGVFAWRLRPYSVTEAPAFCEDQHTQRYRFSLLGNDAPLITAPKPEATRESLAGPLNVPAWIRRRAFQDELNSYYGEGKSLAIYRGLPDENGGKPALQIVPQEQIVAADLSGWAYQPVGGQVAVDPALGRIAFSPDEAATEEGVWVSYHYGFAWEMGGGEYSRPEQPLSAAKIYRVSQSENEWAEYDTLGAAVDQWKRDRPTEAVILILDSGDYTEQIRLPLNANQSLTIAAENGARPSVRMVNLRVGSRDALRFESRWKEGEAGTPPRIVLDGLLISGRPVVVNGRFTCVTIRHCTLVPGWSIDEHCEPTDAEESSLELINTEAEALIERSIVGTIIVRQDEVKTDPLPLTIEDSIVDSTGPKEAALCGRGGRYAFTHLTMRRTTVFGPVLVHAVALAENSIFMDPMRVVRSQIGCMRFCYVPEGSRTPRRYHCQPDEALSAVDASPCLAGEAHAGERKVRKAVELRRVRPQISCNRYGYPDYARLALTCAEEIAQGADDRSEMGAYHDLYNPQRLANLRRRLDEYTPAGMESGVIFET